MQGLEFKLWQSRDMEFVPHNRGLRIVIFSGLAPTLPKPKTPKPLNSKTPKSQNDPYPDTEGTSWFL